MYALLVILQTVVLPLLFGGIHLGVAGIRHLTRLGKNTNEIIATWTELPVFVPVFVVVLVVVLVVLVVLVGVVAAGLRSW